MLFIVNAHLASIAYSQARHSNVGTNIANWEQCKRETRTSGCHEMK